MSEKSETSWWLEWADDPIALAGIGRRVGALVDARELVHDRYPHARTEGPFPSGAGPGLGLFRVSSARELVGWIRELPADFEPDGCYPERAARRNDLARMVDEVRAGRMTHEDYARWVRESRGKEGGP